MKYFFGLFIAACVFLSPAFASAHFLQVQGSVQAVMHIDPDDDPIIRQPAVFFFELNDKLKQFAAEKCNCTAGILNGSAEVFTTDLFKNGNADLKTAAFNYTFQQKGVYSVRLTAKPKNQNDFQAFTLTYDIRVDRESGDSARPWYAGHYLHLVLFGGVFLFFFGKNAVDTLKEKRKNKKV